MGDDSDTDRLAGTIKEKEEVSENGRGRRRIRYGQCMVVLCQDLAQNKMRSSATKLLIENSPSHTFFQSR